MSYVKTDITNIGDPFVLKEGDTYYMYATSFANGFLVWKGKDLSKLEKAGICYDGSQGFGKGSFWAPEVIKRKDGMFVMHFTARDELGLLRTGVAVSDRPEGPFVDVHPDEPMFTLDLATIDATCFVDDDGQGYLYFGKDCSTNVVDGVHTSQLFVAKLDESLTKLTSEPKLISTPDVPWEHMSLPNYCIGDLSKWRAEKGEEAWIWNEGPTVLKHDGKYYLTYSTNYYCSIYYSVCYSVAESPLGPFKKYKGNPILAYIPDELSGPGHNSFFYDNGKLICVFHSHTDYNNPCENRRMCYCEARFTDGVLEILYK